MGSEMCIRDSSRVFGDHGDRAAVQDALYLTDESGKALVICGLFKEKSAQNFSNRADGPFPKTSMMRSIRRIETPFDVSLQHLFMNFIMIPFLN